MLALDRTLDDVNADLDIRGYSLIRTRPDLDALTDTASGFGAHVGAASMGVKVLEAQGSPDWLPRHTENLTDPTTLSYFALGCLEPAASGGATCLYDGRLAASALLADLPELARVSITYATQWRPNTATHPLIVNDPEFGPVLRYRSNLPTNTLAAPMPIGLSESDMYAAVEAALSEAVTLAHLWRPGDLLIVNNQTMLHARQPFEGTRRMVRYRYDDPHFQTVIISG